MLFYSGQKLKLNDIGFFVGIFQDAGRMTFTLDSGLLIVGINQLQYKNTAPTSLPQEQNYREGRGFLPVEFSMFAR